MIPNTELRVTVVEHNGHRGVRVRHLPTDEEVVVVYFMSQAANLRKAKELLEVRLLDNTGIFQKEMNRNE